MKSVRQFQEASCVRFVHSRIFHRALRELLPSVAIASTLVVGAPCVHAGFNGNWRDAAELLFLLGVSVLAAICALTCYLLIPRTVSWDGNAIAINRPGIPVRLISITCENQLIRRTINERFEYLTTTDRSFLLIVHRSDRNGRDDAARGDVECTKDV